MNRSLVYVDVAKLLPSLPRRRGLVVLGGVRSTEHGGESDDCRCLPLTARFLGVTLVEEAGRRRVGESGLAEALTGEGRGDVRLGWGFFVGVPATIMCSFLCDRQKKGGTKRTQGRGEQGDATVVMDVSMSLALVECCCSPRVDCSMR